MIVYCEELITCFIKDRSSNQVWVKFHKPIYQRLFIKIFNPDIEYIEVINVYESGVWWFSLPEPLEVYEKIKVYIANSSGNILYSNYLE
tara:strand:- start:40 stop:306 length:267 start_codon:yes stop_codon:yes gene_type:complete